MKRLLGILLLVCLSSPVWALSAEGKAILEKMRAKYQPVPAGQAPEIVPIPMNVTEKNGPMAADPEFSGQQEGTYQPSPDLPSGNFSDLNAVDPTVAHEENGKIVPGAPKKIKGAKSYKKSKTKGKAKASAKNKKKTKTIKKSKKSKTTK